MATPLGNPAAGQLSGLLLPLQALSTFAMCGVIWFVQLVHYPLFQRVGAAQFQGYATAHATRTTWVVAPLMLLELLTAGLLLLPSFRPWPVPAAQAWAGIALLGVVWLSTALVQVPLHDRLRTAYSLAAAQQLVHTNWVRTVAWSLRGALVFVWLLRASGQ